MQTYLRQIGRLALVFTAALLAWQPAPAPAQDEAVLAAVMPPAPASGIRDSAGLMSREPKRLEAMVKRLEEIERKHGFRIYVALEPILITHDLASWASLLQQAWLPADGGLVLVYEVDTRSASFGWNALAPEETSRLGMPSHAYVTIRSKVMNVPETLSTDPASQVEWMVFTLAEGVDEYFRMLEAPAPAGRKLRVTLVALGGLAGIGLLAMLIGLLNRLSSDKQQPPRYFPPSDRPERLGAPCGGGEVVCHRFAEPIPPKDAAK